MKCPKCGYLGFDSIDRCRNCGYDFSLSAQPDPDLPIRTEPAAESNDAFDDLTRIDAAMSAPLPWQLAADRSVGPASRDAEPVRQLASGRASRGSDLPLFGGSSADDLPLITKPSPPRAPLAVRRATPEVPRMRPEPRAPLLDLSTHAGVSLPDATIARPAPEEWAEASGTGEGETAAVPARLVAVALDLAILAAIDALVVYFTMQICGLTAADLKILPKVPLAAFLIVQNGGYLVAFTAGGQTLGKMAAGIRVVSARDDDPINIGRSILRTLVWALLAIPAGLGFATALFSRERRGLHDYFAGTRVVRAI
jgi:uncharacterized RDD family membrane protein YckC